MIIPKTELLVKTDAWCVDCGNIGWLDSSGLCPNCAKKHADDLRIRGEELSKAIRKGLVENESPSDRVYPARCLRHCSLRGPRPHFRSRRLEVGYPKRCMRKCELKNGRRFKQ